MIMYLIMSLLLGFSANKLFGKEKSVRKSIKSVFITAALVLSLHN